MKIKQIDDEKVVESVSISEGFEHWSILKLNYFVKMFVIYFMDKETMDLYESCKGLNNTVIQEMSIQELFDIRHDMLDLMNTLGQLLSE